MKRLMALGLVAVIAGSAYAQEGAKAYNFAACVQTTNVKYIDVPVAAPVKTRTSVQVKYVQNTVLYGYIIDPGMSDGSCWGVIANKKTSPDIAHLFGVMPIEVRIFDPSGRIFGGETKTDDSSKIVLGAEGGLIMTQGELDEGDNQLYVPEEESSYAVNRYGLFGYGDQMFGQAWLIAAGFGSLKLDFNNGTYGLRLRGSILGGWRKSEWGMDTQICGMDLGDVLSGVDFNQDGNYDFHHNCWISGVWAITPCTILSTVGEALQAINPYQYFDDVDDYYKYQYNTLTASDDN